MWRKRRSRNVRRILCVEVLEDRMLLTGNVIAMRDNTGLLSLIGDNADNALALAQILNGALLVNGLNGTTVNGQPFQIFNQVSALSIQFQNGNDSVLFDGVNNPGIPGPITITAGTGNNTISLDNATFQRADITVGSETNGAVGSNMVDVSNDVITGNGNAGNVNVSVLNQSGVSGSKLGGGPGSVNTLTMNNLQFTGGGNLSARVDDGVPYFHPGQNFLSPASTAQVMTVNTTGNIGVTLGDHFQNVQTNNSNAAKLTESVGSDVDTVQVTGNTIGRTENITVGNNSPYPTQVLPTPFVRVNGAVGSGLFNDGLRVTVGNNTNPTVPAWPVEVVNTGVNGNLALAAGNGVALNVDPTNSSGLLNITMGSGGINGIESLTMLGVTSSDPLITFNSNAGDVVQINLSNVVITDFKATLQIQDFGHGVDIVNLSDVHVAGFLKVLLSNSGHNDVTARNVSCAFGFINGGAGFANHFHNQGGNSGFVIFNFAP